MRHFERLAPHVIGKLALKPNDLVIDIGCNDGTLLACFANHGIRVLGVDPGERMGELARKRGITVFRQFWNSDTGKSLRQLGVRPEVITATAVFYHAPDLHDFMVGLSEIMGQNTCFVVQGVNLKRISWTTCGRSIHQYLASGGRFIVPVPKALVVGPKD